MDNIEVENVKYMMELYERRSYLLNKIRMLDINIDHIQMCCIHLGVDLGKDKCRCLLCGKDLDKEKDEITHIVDASEYMPSYNVEIDSMLSLKYDCIQTMALGLLKDREETSRKDLVNRLNNIINEALKVENGKKRVLSNIKYKHMK